MSGSDLPEAATFSAWDYVVFTTVLLISAAIGLYHACSGGKQKTTQEFLMANRSMSAIPVALSVLASFFSASTLLGTPAEVYLRGTQYWMAVWGAMVAPCIGAYLFGPMFHRMNVVSVNEYLEKRYNSVAVRIFGAILFIIKATLGMGIVLFGPSVALNEVTGFPVWATIVLVGVVCCFYTAIGGMKAVIWTDVFQTGVMLAGILAAIIQGCIKVGGFSEVWRISKEGGRIEFLDFDPDPTTRHTFWTLVIGNIFVWLPPYTVDQQMIQRFASTKSLKQAVWSLLLNAPGMFIIITLCCITGLVMYAYYATCDPLAAGIVDDPNQLLPRFVMDIFVDAPGVPGLFVASLFSGALSSVSSMLNSLAAVTWEDFCKLCPCAHERTEAQATTFNKLFAVGYAVLGICMGFVFSNIGGTVLQMSIAFNGAAGAPLVGIFILGAFFPWSNSKGAIVGGICGFAFPMWISIGAYVTKPDVLENLNTTTEGCPWLNNGTFYAESDVQDFERDPALLNDAIADTFSSTSSQGVEKLYELSYLWYTATGILVTVIIGIIVSFITGATDPQSIDPALLIPYVDKFWCCCPESCKKPLRCGIKYQIQDMDEKESEDESNTDTAKTLNWKEQVGVYSTTFPHNKIHSQNTEDSSDNERNGTTLLPNHHNIEGIDTKTESQCITKL